MDAVNFVGADLILGQPKDWDTAKQGVHIDAIRAKRITVGNTPAIMTLWLPTEEERALLADGHAVVLMVLGSQFPPVSLAVAKDKLVPATPKAGDPPPAGGDAP